MCRAGLLALLGVIALGAAPTARADRAVDAEPVPAAGVAVAACERFDAALSHAARYYDEFAYATAGTGDVVDYRDPEVWRSNVIGRTALREAAQSVFSASRVPGLAPEVADPMRSWSLHATKLLVVMGLRAGGDSLNSAANQLNADAQEAQAACALHAGRA